MIATGRRDPTRVGGRAASTGGTSAASDARPSGSGTAPGISRRGTLIVADNVVRKGAVADSTSADPKVQGVRRFNELLAADPRLSATVFQTVGSKGYDGLAIALVTADI